MHDKKIAVKNENAKTDFHSKANLEVPVMWDVYWNKVKKQIY